MSIAKQAATGVAWNMALGVSTRVLTLVGQLVLAHYMLGVAIANLIIDRLRYVPERLIMRSLRFRTLATINGAGEIAYMATALAVVKPWGAYAVMFGALAKSAITSVMFFYAAPRSEWLVRARLRAADVRDLM